MSAADAEKAFMEAVPATPQTDTDIMRENELLKGRIKVREDQLQQAIIVANKANDAQKARDEAAKEDLITRIIANSPNHKITADQLKDRSLSDLRFLATYVETSMDQTFQSVAALQAEKDAKKLQGIDYWDNSTHEWRLK